MRGRSSHTPLCSSVALKIHKLSILQPCEFNRSVFFIINPEWAYYGVHPSLIWQEWHSNQGKKRIPLNKSVNLIFRVIHWISQVHLFLRLRTRTTSGWRMEHNTNEYSITEFEHYKIIAVLPTFVCWYDVKSEVIHLWSDSCCPPETTEFF